MDIKDTVFSPTNYGLTSSGSSPTGKPVLLLPGRRKGDLSGHPVIVGVDSPHPSFPMCVLLLREDSASPTKKEQEWHQCWGLQQQIMAENSKGTWASQLHCGRGEAQRHQG